MLTKLNLNFHIIFTCTWCPGVMKDNSSTNPDSSPRSEPALELHSRAATSVGGTSPFKGPNTGSNSGGGLIKKTLCLK